MPKPLTIRVISESCVINGPTMINIVVVVVATPCSDGRPSSTTSHLVTVVFIITVTIVVVVVATASHGKVEQEDDERTHECGHAVVREAFTTTVGRRVVSDSSRGP